MDTKKQEFIESFQILKSFIEEDLKNSYKAPKEVIDWMLKNLDYNVPGGKLNRGLTVVDTLEVLKGRNNLTKQDIFKAHILGWCIEILQAFFLITDDIMDHSETRRGKPCYYKLENIGMVAINDAIILESLVYKLLGHYFRKEHYYVDLLELFHETTFQTEIGQSMDVLTAPENYVDLNRFSIAKHGYIVEYKTAYYSFYLPVALGLILGGITKPEAFEQAKSFLLSLGEYFQTQDDYLDCFGDPEVIGKIGTDIKDNKCSWLIVQALDKCSPEQRRSLEKYYGSKNPEDEQKVKMIYNELKLKDLFHQYEEESYQRLNHLISTIDEQLLPHQIFKHFLNKIYKRNK